MDRPRFLPQAPTAQPTLLFRGPIGSEGTFEVVGKKGVVRRLPAGLSATNVRIRVEVSGGDCGADAAISFRPDDEILAYFQNGTLSKWQTMLDVRVESGDVVNVPQPGLMWTGKAGKSPGWVITTHHQPRKSNTFASTRVGGWVTPPAWKKCNSAQATTGDETATLGAGINDGSRRRRGGPSGSSQVTISWVELETGTS